MCMQISTGTHQVLLLKQTFIKFDPYFSALVFSFFPTLEQETPLWEDEGRTETEAEGEAQLVGLWVGWLELSEWVGWQAVTLRCWKVGSSRSPGRAEQQSPGMAQKGHSWFPRWLPSFCTWLLVQCQDLWWLHHLRTRGMSFLKGLMGSWGKRLTHLHQWYKNTDRSKQVPKCMLQAIILKECEAKDEMNKPHSFHIPFFLT